MNLDLLDQLRRAPIRTALIVFLGAGVLIVALRVALTPWSLSLTGGPTLTGEWLGYFTTPTGGRHWLWLEIDHPLGDGCYDCPPIEGRVETCDRTGSVVRYSMWGDVENWRGTRVSLKTREEEPAKSEVRLLFLAGEWDGNALRMTTTLVAPGYTTTTHWEKNEAGVETTRTIDGHPDTLAPIKFVLSHGTKDAFEARCARVRSGK